MNNFSYTAPAAADAAFAGLGALAASPVALGGGKFIAGGTNLIDLMKENVMRPARLVDINGLGLDGIGESADGGLLLGALARNADTAYHPLVRQRYPLLTAAILAGASAQIRNMASNGGNLLQRTRCVYFYDTGVPCNKREPGTGCPARTGLARQHAIMGTSEHCIATHPSDMCVALAALGAVVHVQSPRGLREIAFSEFHRLPGDTPHIDSTLEADELITHIALPPAPQFAGHSAYLKLRDRASYAFALVSVAAALQVEGGMVREVRIAVGGVAHKPWRSTQAEALLVGQPAGAPAFEATADSLFNGAQAFGSGPGRNDFKITMAKRAVVRALETAMAGTVTNTGEDVA